MVSGFKVCSTHPCLGSERQEAALVGRILRIPKKGKMVEARLEAGTHLAPHGWPLTAYQVWAPRHYASWKAQAITIQSIERPFCAASLQRKPDRGNAGGLVLVNDFILEELLTVSANEIPAIPMKRKPLLGHVCTPGPMPTMNPRKYLPQPVWRPCMDMLNFQVYINTSLPMMVHPGIKETYGKMLP